MAKRNVEGFTASVLQSLWDAVGLDGEDIQALGLKFGVIKEVRFDPTVHVDAQGCGVEVDDPWFVPTGKS